MSEIQLSSMINVADFYQYAIVYLIATIVLGIIVEIVHDKGHVGKILGRIFGFFFGCSFLFMIAFAGIRYTVGNQKTFYDNENSRIYPLESYEYFENSFRYVHAYSYYVNSEDPEYSENLNIYEVKIKNTGLYNQEDDTYDYIRMTREASEWFKIHYIDDPTTRVIEFTSAYQILGIFYLERYKCDVYVEKDNILYSLSSKISQTEYDEYKENEKRQQRYISTD